MKRIAFSLLLAVALPAAAHVVVNPPQAGVGKFQTFTVSVPVEKNQPTVALRLVLPAGLEAVLPTVKSGWTIETVPREHDGEASALAEIRWTGSSIPAGRRDDFGFSAKLPARETVLAWKAYQTYADGSVVAWERDPQAGALRNDKGQPDFSKAGPWSQTRVVDDLKSAGAIGTGDVALWLSVAAMALAFLALIVAWSARGRR